MSDARRPPADDGDADSDGGGGGGGGEGDLWRAGTAVLSLYCGRRYWEIREVLLLSFYNLLAYIPDAHIYLLIVLLRFNIQSVHLSVFLYLIIMIICYRDFILYH